MKKLLVILFLLAYGFSASGMTVHLHYCCGKLKSIEWAPVSDNECGEKHSMGSKPCCETKKISNSNDADQEYLLVAAKMAKFSKLPVVHTDAVVVQARTISTFQYFSPVSPPHPSSPLFIQYCVFRI
jgi:hypothetical protein